MARKNRPGDIQSFTQLAQLPWLYCGRCQFCDANSFQRECSAPLSLQSGNSGVSILQKTSFLSSHYPHCTEVWPSEGIPVGTGARHNHSVWIGAEK
jgi:hypothetical protein